MRKPRPGGACGSAHLSRWARIETKKSCTIHFYRSRSAHLSRWARIETIFPNLGERKNIVVAPTFRGGRGLKLKSEYHLILSPDRSAHLSRWARIETRARRFAPPAGGRSAHLSRWARIETTKHGTIKNARPRSAHLSRWARIETDCDSIVGSNPSK